MVVLNVDVILIIDNEGLIGQMKDQMMKRFRMRYRGNVSCCLSMNIECNREPHTIDIHQHSDIWRFFAKF